ncbi:tetratricopeptide repeat protein [Luteibacter yeojuensis]|uniref:tetratricopeptide repeat protein n=1 Tax=Luteibacter yeojuensis TaxID=345309 RepID=UPI0018DD85C2|nr:SEL1-like repeat protein [Luteibacter yeojuensis]
MYETGERRRTVQLLLKAALAGVREAQLNLANIYDDADGVRRDIAKGRYWYKRAITQGLPEGAYNLGMSYLNRGDKRRAKRWFMVAKSMGSEDAVERLSR